MAVDMQDLVEGLKGKLNPPGFDLYPNSNDGQWVVRLTDAFWSARLAGMLEGFEENAATRGGPEEFGEGIITPLRAEVGYDEPDGYLATEDLSRELQQIIVLWAAWNVTLSKMMQIKTLFRSKAGPVEYETQQSATLLKAVLDSLKEEMTEAKKGLRGTASGRVFDAFVERSYSQYANETVWVR